MSISMKSSKSQMYSEIERLRALLEANRSTMAMLEENIVRRDDEILALDAKCQELTTQLQGRAQQTAARGDRATRMLITKRLAVTLKSTVRWNEEYGFEYMDDGHWTVVPRNTLAFVTSGIQS